jgi:AraC-like DNA-binding protein
MLRSTTMAVNLVEFATSCGLDESRCLEQTGIDRSTLNSPRSEITEEQELALVRNLVRHLGPQPGLGLQAGRRVHATTYGVLGLGLISSSTARAALGLAARNVELCMTLSDLRFADQRGDHVAVFDDRKTPADVQRFLFERDMTIYTRFFAESLSADVRPARITCRLPAPPPETADRYTAVFGVRPEFDQTTNSVVHRSRDLDRPMPQAHHQTADLAEQLCRDIIQRRCARGGVRGQVTDVLRRASKWRLAEEEVARSLAMSPRSLRRHLRDEGTSFRRLAHEWAMERAREMLAGGLTVEETARRLGYSEASAFSRAFKQSAGSTPGAYARLAGEHVGPLA